VRGCRVEFVRVLRVGLWREEFVGATAEFSGVMEFVGALLAGRETGHSMVWVESGVGVEVWGGDSRVVCHVTHINELCLTYK